MKQKQFEYGLIAQGIFAALVSLVPVVFILYKDEPRYTLYYLGFLLFLGAGLRPVLEFFHVIPWLDSLNKGLVTRMDRRSMKKLKQKIDLKARDRKYKRAHRQNDRLPPNW